MGAKDIRLGRAAQERILAGVQTVAKVVGSTLGPKGKTVLLQQFMQPPRSTKDGVSVAREIELLDKFENMGAALVLQVANKTAQAVGDGTTTATVLAEAILTEGFKLVTAGMNPMDLRRGIDRGVECVVQALVAASRPVHTDEEIAHVGTISANGERDIGELMANAHATVGRDGVLTLEEGKEMETTFSLVEGLSFDRGYLSGGFITNVERRTCELDLAHIILYDRSLPVVKPLIHVLDAIQKAGAAVLLVVEDMDSEPLNTLLLNKFHKGMKICVVKCPSFGAERAETMEDIAILTGATVISNDRNMNMLDIKREELGRARRVVVSRDSTIIMGGEGSQEALNARIAALSAQLETVSDEKEKSSLRLRLAKLQNGVGVIRVGGATEAEVSERKDRVEDAMFATKAAIREGILPGGGVALLRARKALRELQESKVCRTDEAMGLEVVYKALGAPARRILENAGNLEGSSVLAAIEENDNPAWGYNAQTDEYVDMLEAGIMDPTSVVRTALQDAASIAGLLLTTDAMVAEFDPLEIAVGMNPMGAPGSPARYIHDRFRART